MWTQCQNKTLCLSTSWREILEFPLLCSKSLFFSCICFLVCLFVFFLLPQTAFIQWYYSLFLLSLSLTFFLICSWISVMKHFQCLSPHNYLIDWIFYILNFVIALKYLPLAAQLVRNGPAMQETRVQSLGREDSLEKKMATTPVFLPGESHGQRSLAGYSPWGCKELDTTQWLNYHHHT